MAASDEAPALVDKFLDLACLAYTGADRPHRRNEATELLAANPGWIRTNIHVAAATGAGDQVEDLLAADAARASRVGGPRNWEPLLYLAYSRVAAVSVTRDYLRVARLLLEHGADADASFPLWGSTFTAVTGVLGEGEQGPENQPPHPQTDDLLPLLLGAGAAANDPQGAYNRMHRNDDGWLRTLLTHGLQAEDRINWDMGEGPRPRTLDFLLAHAVDNRFIDRIALLLDHGADPSCRNPYNGRPIRTNALLSGSTAVVEMLEAAGAEAVSFTVAEQFRMALANGDGEEARRLVSVDPSCLDDVTLLRDAAGNGDQTMVALLLDLGVDVNAADGGGVTPLHKAAENGRMETIELLLSRGADPTLKDSQFAATPHAWATHAGQLAAAEILRVT